MGDAGEGLVDTEARIQERIEEREEERKRRQGPKTLGDPRLLREIESLRLARGELERQAAQTPHDARRQQLKLAIEEIDRRLAAAGQAR